MEIIPLSYNHWKKIAENISFENDSAKEMIIIEEEKEPSKYDIYTHDNPMENCILEYTNEKPKCYITSNGYTLNIPEKIFNRLIEVDDYITTNEKSEEKIKINKIQYLPSVKEYKLFLNKKIYQFTEEDYNETYVSKYIECKGYKMASEEADIDVIKTNLQCIFINCLANMDSIYDADEAVVQKNIRKYYAALYVYYSWILIRLVDNIKTIVDNKYTQSYTDTSDAQKVYINKYLARGLI